MSIEKRIAKLEQFQKKAESMVLTGVLNFHPGCLFVDGADYQDVKDIPEALQEKYREQLTQ